MQAKSVCFVLKRDGVSGAGLKSLEKYTVVYLENGLMMIGNLLSRGNISGIEICNENGYGSAKCGNEG